MLAHACSQGSGRVKRPGVTRSTGKLAEDPRLFGRGDTAPTENLYSHRSDLPSVRAATLEPEKRYQRQSKTDTRAGQHPELRARTESSATRETAYAL